MPKVGSAKTAKGNHVIYTWPEPNRLPSTKMSTMHLKNLKRAFKSRAAVLSVTPIISLSDAMKDIPIASIEFPPTLNDAPQPPLPFMIVELLTEILLHLPPADLLMSQKVCKLWKATVESSGDIQRALFFRPAKRPVTMFPVRRVAQNPFLASCFQANGIHFGLNSVKTNSAVVVINTIGILRAKEPLPDAFLYPHASWRKMLLAKKPLATFHVHERYGKNNEKEVIVRCIERVEGEGVRLEDVVRTVKAVKKTQV